MMTKEPATLTEADQEPEISLSPPIQKKKIHLYQLTFFLKYFK